MKKLNKNNKGFSLVELLVVIAIMVVLVGVIAPSLLGNIEKSRASKDIQNLDNVAAAIQDSLMVEKAYNAAPADNTIILFSDIYDTTPTTLNATTNADFISQVKEYLPTGSKIELSSKNAKNGAGVICFKIVKGSITVWAGDKTTHSTVLKDASGNELTVTR